MYKGVEYSKPLSFICAVAIAGCIASGIAASSAREQAAQAKRNNDRVILDMQTAIARMEKQGDAAALKAAQDRAAEWNSRLVLPGSIEQIVRGLGSAWSYNPQAGVLPNGLTTCDVRYLETSVSDWPTIVTAAQSIESLSPFCGLREIVVSSDGDTTNRRFSLVRFTVAYRQAPPPAP
jgi:hypothetical protein